MKGFWSAAHEFDENPSSENAGKLFAEMQASLRKVLSKIDLDEARRITESMKQERLKKCENTLKFMPNGIVGKIAFLANLMENLVPDIFNEDSDKSEEAYCVFSDFLYDEMEPAMGELEEECRKNRIAIPSHGFIAVCGDDELKTATEACLDSIKRLCLEKERKEDEILERLYRLSNLNLFLNRKIFCGDNYGMKFDEP